MNDSSAPRVAESMLEALGADSDFRDDVIGDLAEEFATRLRIDGRIAARRWYLRESVRVAPYLLRDWWRRLERRDLGPLASVLIRSSAFLMLFERVAQPAMRAIAVALSGPHTILGARAWPISAGTIAIPALMLLWTLGDGVLAGWVAARLSRRAPLPGALALAIAWGGVMTALNVVPGYHVAHTWVPLWFRATNVMMLSAGMIVGGVIAAVRSGASRRLLRG
jgi:hypothetical protein